MEADVAALRDYAQTAEELGFRHLVAYDHVLGADPEIHEGWDGPYDVHTSFHEPLVLFGWLAAFSTLELVTGILILPQRQTALVAKQAAEVDILSGGRLRLGVGVGWNAVEYEALGMTWSDRGRRSVEQIELLRRLWTQSTVTYTGHSETVTGAGLCPLPIQRPIPIWIGGTSERTYERIGKIADGWFPMVTPGRGLEEAKKLIDDAARDSGRDPGSIGMEGRVTYSGDDERFLGQLSRWEQIGATHVDVNTMGTGLAGTAAHIEAIQGAAAAIRSRRTSRSDVAGAVRGDIDAH
jgi:probable F420-dependent oxidoreductase